MNYTLNAYPQYLQSRPYFGRDSHQWIALLGDVPAQLPIFLAKTLRSECIDAHWFEGTLALQKAMENHPAYEILWGGTVSKEDSVLLETLQSDDLPLFHHFLNEAGFELVRDIFIGVAPQYSPALKRHHLRDMLEDLAQKMMRQEKQIASWLSKESNQDILEETLAFAQLESLWRICEPYASFENKWQRLSDTLLRGEIEKTYFHKSNSVNKQFIGMWNARPDINRLTPDLKKMVANHLVFSDIAAVVSKDSLEKALDTSSNAPRSRRL